MAQLNLPVAELVWLMIVRMPLKIDLAALREVGQLARHRHDRRRQLADQDILDGALGLDVRRASRSAMAASRSGEQLYRRPHSAGGRALHRHGVRLVELGGRRAAFHAVAGGAQRPIMVVAFAPIVGLLLGLSSISVTPA